MRRCITTSSEQYKLAFAVSMGGMLELYDFLIYALMAGYIAEHFFPAGDKVSSLLGTFATFAVGYLTRPIGGLVFGHYGDRYGRKKTFIFSIFLMAISTVMMGLLPGFSSIGLFAPVCLVCLRLVQGFSLGGEVPGAITYLSESSPERQGLVVGILFLALMIGISLGTFVHGFLTLYLDPKVMMDWGWRIPFWLGGVLGFLSYLIRRRFSESGYFMALDQVRQRTRVPLKILFRDHLPALFCALLVMALCGATITVYGIYMPSYLSALLGFPKDEVAWHSALAFFVLAPVPVLAGLCCDLFNRKLLLAILALLVAVLAWPTFQYFVSEQAQLRKILVICSLYTGIASGLLPPLLVNLFPTEVRYTGIATAYNTGVALFGGMAPLLSTYMVDLTGLAEGPAIYMIVIALLSLCSLMLPWPYQTEINKIDTDCREKPL